ncbi:hypothetical protein I4F81_004750 [Pyropia yezoensis]|uniref:Uncharacterized protein n=1 Tax=Pyropia yezoensis TaxID=2788 RepID=A0ACC3BWR2_PYRYE|nr:hypothetical protein I4F81_004750 [Neopyropia yezoensis]
MVTGPINKFLARGSQHPRSQASPGRVFTAPKLSAVASTFVGNLSFSACLSSAFLPPGMTARSLAEYSKGGAVIFYDATAPLKLLLTPDQNRHFLACIERGVCKIGDVVTVKVHTAMLSQPEPHTLRAASNMVLAVAPTGCPGIFMDSLPIPLAWAKSLPPWCVFSSVLTLNMQTIRSMGATSSVQVVDRVGEHAMLTMPSRNLSNLLGELNRVTLTDVLFTSLCSPSNASRAFHFGDGATVEGVFKEVNFTTGMTFNQTYWWVPMVSTPVPTLEADRIAANGWHMRSPVPTTCSTTSCPWTSAPRRTLSLTSWRTKARPHQLPHCWAPPPVARVRRRRRRRRRTGRLRVRLLTRHLAPLVVAT